MGDWLQISVREPEGARAGGNWNWRLANQNRRQGGREQDVSGPCTAWDWNRLSARRDKKRELDPTNPVPVYLVTRQPMSSFLAKFVQGSLIAFA